MWYEMTCETCPCRGFVRFDNLEKCKKVIIRSRSFKEEEGEENRCMDEVNSQKQTHSFKCLQCCHKSCATAAYCVVAHL